MPAVKHASDPILVAEGVQRHFGGVAAVDVELLEVPRGQITALIGPNGAGKTTLFNCLTGFDSANAGKWSFDGEPMQNVDRHRVARRGMVRTFQLTRVLGRLTVMENMLLGARQSGEKFSRSLFKPLWKADYDEATERAWGLLKRFKLDTKADDHAASLSGGQRKLLEMARALMTQPKLLMLDEPMAGVNPALVQSLLSHITDLRDEGLSILFVEHDMHVVKEISDWVVVMAEGRVVAEGESGPTLANPAVIDAYLGAHHDVDLRAIIREREAGRA